MTDEEKQVWNAAYAAWYVAELMDVKKSIERSGAGAPRETTQMVAAHHVNADAAIYAADRAVADLRKWRLREDADAGFKLTNGATL